MSSRASTRLPAIYLPHGGGPWPFVDLGMPRAELDALTRYLRVNLRNAATPRAILAISAHWEAAVPTVQTAFAPPLLFDYSGFPPESYRLTWPAPGAPELAARVGELLTAAQIPNASDNKRGFDHGTFVPLKVAFPEAEIPTIQLSLKTGLSPTEHLSIGRALAPLRDEGVLLLGSGMSFHNMRAFRFGGAVDGQVVGKDFDDWLKETVALPAAERNERLANWAVAPGGRFAHPREEHLLPLHVIAGAALEDRATIPYSQALLGAQVSAFHFGA